MAETLVSDVIVPELFLPYTIQRTAELSAFVQGGIVDMDAQFTALCNEGGQTADMPFWQDLAGNDEVVDDATDLAVDGITAAQDVTIKHQRAKAWGANDLAGILAGDDPMMAIGDLVAAYWDRREQYLTFNMLNGVFSAASMSGLISAIHATSGSPSAANYLTGVTFIDAQQLLGDAKEKLAAISMHSIVESSLRKQDLIDFIPDSEGKSAIKTFQGLRVLVDDGHPVTVVNGHNVYTSYLYGMGAIAGGVGTVDQKIEGGIGTWQLEFARKGLSGMSYMINRRRFIRHIRGVKWLGISMAKKSPTNAELANGANWQRVYELKNIRVVKITHNIAS